MRRDIKRRTGIVIAAGVAALALHAAPVRAHDGTAEEQAACTPDVLSLCFWEIPDEERIVACLNKKIDRLSPACRKVMESDRDAKDTGKTKPSAKR